MNRPIIITDEIRRRLAKSFEIDPATNCWNWIGRKRNKFGHGSIGIENKEIVASRVAYTAWKGEIPKGLCICHRCDNPSCINPDHLFIGTQKDNINDAAKKGRMISGRRKLSDPQISEIRSSPLRCGVLAELYGVNCKTIWSIKRGQTYLHPRP